MSKLSLIIVGTMCLAALFAVSDAALPCGVDSPLGFLDFSDLKLTGSGEGKGFYVAKEQTTSGDEYNYQFNVCNIDGGSGCQADGKAANENTIVCQTPATGAGAYVVARLMDDAENMPKWTYDDTSKPPRAKYSFHTGDPCGTNNRTANINFVCDPKNKIGTMTALSVLCDYEITVNTVYACSGGIKKKKGSDDGLSGGWIFFIIIMVTFPIYVAAGCFWNYRKANIEGESTGVMQLMPNREFWISLPGLVTDGCKYTYQKLRSLCNKGGSGSEGEYSSVE